MIIISNFTICYWNTYTSTNCVQIIYAWATNKTFKEFTRPNVQDGKNLSVLVELIWVFLPRNGIYHTCRRSFPPLLDSNLYAQWTQKEKSHWDTVCIIEPQLLYRWALATSSFEAPWRRPSLHRNRTGYIDLHGTPWIAQSNRQRYPCRQGYEKTSRHWLMRFWHQRRQEHLFLQRL